MDNQPNLNESLAVLKSVLGSRVVSYQPVFAKALRSVPAAVMLSQAYWWQQNANFKDLVEMDGRQFFTKTIQDWYDATGMTKEQQMTARELLRMTGFWVERKAGLPAKLYFHVDLNALVVGISDYLSSGNPITDEIFSQITHNQRNSKGHYVAGKPDSKKSGFPTHSRRESRQQGVGNPDDIGIGNPDDNIIKVESLESLFESVEREKGNARAEKKPAVEILETEPVGGVPLNESQKSLAGSPGRGAASSNPSPSSAAPLPFASSPWANIAPASWADHLLPLCDDLPGNLDTAYYMGRCRDWSAEKGGKSADWLATAARFAHEDFRKNKLVTIKTDYSHDTDTNGNPSPYRSSIIDPAKIAARVERILRRRGEWPGA